MRHQTTLLRVGIPALLVLLLTQAGAPASVEDDRKSVPEPAERHVSANFDFFMSGLAGPAAKSVNVPGNIRRILRSPQEARNVSELDEVPDSSWFNNRNFWSPLSAQTFHQGPIQVGHAPDSGPWTVTKCKTDGVTPGIQIRDQKRDVYLLKFDPPGHLELATAPDVIASKFLYAAGYNVPENFIVTFDEHILVPSPDLVCKGSANEKLRSGGLAKLLEKVPRTSQGQLRAMASKFIPGKIKGPFSYSGVRKDDPNDKVPHEDRRELRGLRMIQAFLNNSDVKQLNTLDTYIEEDGEKFLKHYLIDFGDALGSLSLRPKQPGDAYHYLIDPVDLAKRTITLGRNRPRNNSTTEYPSIGYIEGATFDPMRWSPNWPNPAFNKMTKRDGYWGAKLVASFTNEQIEAAVQSGEYSDPDAERTLIQVLEERRDRVADYWFRRVAPLDRFRFTSRGLTFEDLAIQIGLNKPVDVRYEVLIKGQKVTSISPTGYQTLIPVTATESPLNLHIRRILGRERPVELEVIVRLVEGEATVVGIQR